MSSKSISIILIYTFQSLRVFFWDTVYYYYYFTCVLKFFALLVFTITESEITFGRFTTNDNVCSAVILAEPLREFTLFTRWLQNSARRLPIFGPCDELEPVAHLYAARKPHPPSPKSWYSFYHPTVLQRVEGLSGPRWLVTYVWRRSIYHSLTSDMRTVSACSVWWLHRTRRPLYRFIAPVELMLMASCWKIFCGFPWM